MSCSASYTIHGSGLVEVNGAYPVRAGEANRQDVLRVWDKYGSAVSGAARRFGIPKEWVFGILMQESIRGTAKCSPCAACGPKHCETHLGMSCCAFGVMQFTAETARRMGASVDEILRDDTYAIMLGAELLKARLDMYGGDFVKAAAAYNAGGARCGSGDSVFGFATNKDYVIDVVRWSNTAIQMRLPATGSAVTFVIVAASVAAAGAIYTGLWEPRWSRG